MKVNLLSGLLLMLSIGLASSNTHAQNIHTKKIELGFGSTSLKSALSEVEKRSGMSIFYPTEIVERYEVNAIVSTKRTVARMLSELLDGTKLGFRQNGKSIVLFEKANQHLIADQQVNRSGLVKDENGQPLAGVSVLMKNWRQIIKNAEIQSSTATDANGHWSIPVPSDTITLIFSLMGYGTQEIRVGNRTQIEVTLKTSTREIEGVVVTGLFERPKEMYTGAARSFTQEQLQNVTSDNILTAITALDPSFQMPDNINLGSNPNALPDVTLRGGNSLIDPNIAGSNPFNYSNAPNTPLFILDGFEVSLSRINDLDLTRVKSVDLLKDATATSIYGSRAANGVVIIETIRPKAGKLNLSYTGNITVEAPDLRGYDVLNASEKLDLENRLGFYHDSFNFRDQELQTIYNARLAAVKSGVNTDWLAQPVRTGIGQKHNVYIEGGQEEIQYGVGVNYYDNVGVMKNSNRKTMTGNSYLAYRYKNFLFKNDLSIITNTGNNSNYGSFNQYTRLNPYWAPFAEDGSYKVYLEEILNEGGSRLTNFDRYDNLNGYTGRPGNPLYDASLGLVDQNKYHTIVNNFAMEWKAYSWLTFRGTFAYLFQEDESDKFLPSQHSSFFTTPTFERGSYNKGYGKNQRYEGIFTTNLNKSFGKNLIFATLGLNMSHEGNHTESFKVVGFPNASLNNMTQGLQFAQNTKPEGIESIKRLSSMFSNLSYSYDNRYLLDLSLRVDGSSQFGADNRYAPFWSVGAGWNVHNEAFAKNILAVNKLRLRYSFGFTGSQNFESFYGVTTSQYFNNSEYRGIIGTYLLAFGNESLKWQKSRKNNFGLDLVMFNRFDLVGNYYIEKTEGSIANISVAPSSGFMDYKENMGDLLRSGWELYTRFNIINSTANRNNWSLFVNLFSTRNKIQKVSNQIAALNRAADETLSSIPITRYAEGQSTTAIWAVPSLGIDPGSGREIFLTRNGKLTNTYDPLDQKIVGDTRSDVEGTFGSNFEYNGIGVNATLRFRLGGQAYNQTLVDRVENVDVALYNVDRRVAEQRWMQQGDISFFKAIRDASGVLNREKTYATSRFVQDNNVLSIESISIYYRLSDELNKRLGIRNTKVTAYTNDLARFSSVQQERGLVYPFSRSFTFQISASF
ncbi:SusC/RagA family TonB-linked outer membrane protein [Sphingobacterium alkalisoli]|nr:SusC/RagA family TonB-linked outer membrane protein [Sphingobacterium alkalisoli]GGH30488.1 SusC/RagA family TonB-linked outer membrane protein [Sphingobacterium alkalisoli]